MADGVLSGLTIDRRDSMADEAARAAATSRLAAAGVRRYTDTHRCRGAKCRHRNHDRDLQHRELLLDAIGQPDEPARPEDYSQPVSWGTIGPGEADLMR
jgi:hypothetical protein